jgi:hypothetical protein
MILNYLFRVSFVFTSTIPGSTPWISTIKRNVGLRQPRLNCTVVMSHEPNNKVFRFASLASVHCHSTANIIKVRVNKVAMIMILNYLLKVSFIFHVERIRGSTPWISTMKRNVGLRQPRLNCTVVMSHEPNIKAFRFTCWADCASKERLPVREWEDIMVFNSIPDTQFPD